MQFPVFSFCNPIPPLPFLMPFFSRLFCFFDFLLFFYSRQEWLHSFYVFKSYLSAYPSLKLYNGIPISCINSTYDAALHACALHPCGLSLEAELTSEWCPKNPWYSMSLVLELRMPWISLENPLRLTWCIEIAAKLLIKYHESPRW